MSYLFVILLVAAGLVGAVWSFISLVQVFRRPPLPRLPTRPPLWQVRRQILLKSTRGDVRQTRANLLVNGRSFSGRR